MFPELPFDEFQKLANEKGYKVRDCKYGHWQIRFGPTLVHFYPESKKRTLYCPEPYLKAELFGHDESKLFELLQELEERATTQSAVFDEGRRAALAGVEFCANPYTSDGWKKKSWDAGWYAGDDERGK